MENNSFKKRLINCRWEDWTPTNEELREIWESTLKKIKEEDDLKIKQRWQHIVEDNYKHIHPLNPNQENNE